MAMHGGATGARRRACRSDLEPGVAGGSFLGRSDVGEVTRAAIFCQEKGWRLRWVAGESVSSREKNMYEGSMSQMYGRSGKRVINFA